MKALKILFLLLNITVLINTINSKKKVHNNKNKAIKFFNDNSNNNTNNNSSSNNNNNTSYLGGAEIQISDLGLNKVKNVFLEMFQ